MEGKHVINGTFGECILEGQKVAEIKGLKADIGLNYQDVEIAGQLEPDQKFIGTTRTGSMTMSKTNSRMAKLLNDAIKVGKTPSLTIISKLDDPDALGAETVALYGVKFTNLPIVDWTVKQMVEVNMSFTFKDFEYLDMIDEE